MKTLTGCVYGYRVGRKKKAEYRAAADMSDGGIEIGIWENKPFATIRGAKAKLQRLLDKLGFSVEWNNPLVCTHCGSTRHRYIKKAQNLKRLRCSRCKKTGFTEVAL